MQLYPAIDLMSGQAVRLKQGDFDQQTFFGDALTIAKRFKEDGATAIHLIDLDGAKAGEPLHLSLIADIKKETGLFVEAGGGVRNIETVEAYVGAGIDRILVGTVALEDEALLEQMIALAGDKLAVALDAKRKLEDLSGVLGSSATNVTARRKLFETEAMNRAKAEIEARDRFRREKLRKTITSNPEAETFDGGFI